MNKLEKIRNTSGDLVEREEAEREVQEEEFAEESKKTFSFFKLWRRCREDVENEDIEFVNEEEAAEERSPAVFKLLNKKTTVLAACILVIGVAGFLNVRYSNPAETIPPIENEGDIGIASSSVNENDEIVSVENNDDYFALAVINRERVRDEAIEMLKDVAGSDSTDVSAKNEAYVEMTRMANEIANEANIESLVKAKGFSECVAVISNDTANVIVESDGLTINEVAQIKEIVYLECGVLPDNIKIIEKSEV